MLESKVERYLRQMVKARGGRCLKFVSPGTRHVTDRLVLWPISFGGVDGRPPRVHFVELKAPGKKPRKGQLREHARLRNMGFHVFVLDTKEKVRRYVGGQA